MAIISVFSLVLSLLCPLLSPARAQVVVTVDAIEGSDTACVSAYERTNNISAGQMFMDREGPCRTINRALDNVICNASCSNPKNIENVIIRLKDGVHMLTGRASICESRNITLEAENYGNATVTCETFPNTIPRNFDNLLVCGTSGVTFRGLRFEGCGPVPSNVFLRDSSDILFEECTFYNNSGSALQFRFCSGVQVINSRFIMNVNQRQAEPDVNETSIEDLYNSITTGGGFTFFSRGQETDILIQNCSFIENAANRNDPNNSRPVLLKSNGHGGAILIRLAGVNDSQILITDCMFEDNTAQVDGAGIYVSLSESLSSNTIIFRNNHFHNNRVEMASGGAVSVNSFNFTYNNTVIVESCNFTGNHGNAGGAFSVALYDSNLQSTQFPDRVNFTNCSFHDNTASNEGTAVGLFSLVHVDQVGFPVSFEDCTFENNTSLDQPADTSAIAAFRFPTIFRGHNYFIRNRGGGITLLNTRMEASGKLLFDSNSAVFGGGIAMDDRCLLEIGPGMNMTFINNSATESGGGIYVEFPPIRFVVDIFNRLCFLQYSDGSGQDVPPQEWANVTISFIRNTARLSGAAIFASDMQQCGWLGENTTDTSLIFNPPAGLPSPFTYKENTLLPEGLNVSQLRNSSLATAPAQIHLMADHMLVQPGELLPINLLATDQINNSREAVWSLEAPSQQANLDALSANNDTYIYTVPGAESLLGVTLGTTSETSQGGGGAGGQEAGNTGTVTVAQNFSSAVTLNFSLLRTLGSVSTLELNISGCHPGYTLDCESNNGQCVCVCDTNVQQILRCDGNNRYVYLREGTWGGVQEDGNGVRQLITAPVRPGYVRCRQQGRLPGCRFEFDNSDDQCRMGRQGPLCGTCAENYSVTLDLQSCMETPCTAGLVLFILLCVLVVVTALVILLVDLELPNELRGFIFYAQVVGLVYLPYVVVQPVNNATDILGILVNLLGFSVPIPLCISENLKAHHIALLGYISPLLALITVASYIFAARFIRPLSNRSSLKGITFLSLFIYKYLADTSFIFLSCLDTSFGLVFQYDGSLDCVSWEFGIFALIGLALVTFVVLPFPFGVGYICIRRPQRFQHYADVLTKGLKNKHRWFGGWDLGRRLPFVTISFFAVLARPSLLLFLMSLAALVVLIIHLFTKPYEKMHVNIIEAAILLDLLMVTAAFLDPSNSPVPYWFSVVLLVLPYVYAVAFIGYNIAVRLWRRFYPMLKPEKQTPSGQPAQTSETPGTANGDTETRTSASESDKPTLTTGGTLGEVEGGASGSPVRRRQTNDFMGGDEENRFAVLREPLLEL